MLISPIQKDHSRAELIRESAVVVWDEATMANVAVESCVDETCRRVTESNEPFGNKIFILLGDFRQTCPVIRGGTRRQVVDANIRSSPLWSTFSIRRLTQPYRNAEDPEFANFVDTIGDGAGPDVCLDFLNIVHDPQQLVDFVYPDEMLQNPMACLKRAILAPTNRQVNHYNKAILDRLPGESRTYLAADSLKEASEVGLVPPNSVLDHVARQTPPGLPDHTLKIKVSVLFCVTITSLT